MFSLCELGSLLFLINSPGFVIKCFWPVCVLLNYIMGSFIVAISTNLKPTLHVVGRIVSMCLRPCPKEHITALI